MKKIFFVLLFVSISFGASADSARLKACITAENEVFLTGGHYHYYDNRLDKGFENLDFNGVLKLMLERLARVDAVKAQDYSVRLEHLVKNVEMRAGYIIRLQMSSSGVCRSLEGVAMIKDASRGKVWISQDVFERLSPVEKVTVYIDILQSLERINRGATEGTYHEARVGYYFTEWANTTDYRLWIDRYKSALNYDDMYFQTGIDYVDIFNF